MILFMDLPQKLSVDKDNEESRSFHLFDRR